MEEQEKEQSLHDKTNEKVENLISTIVDDGIHSGNVDYLFKLVDIHKDLKNEEYWEAKKEVMDMRYRGNYGRRMRDSRGRYMEGSNYNGNYNGRNYRGEDVLDEISMHYGNYSEGRESYNRGNYGSKQENLESLTYMLQSVVEFMGMLKQEAGSQEEFDLIKRYAQTLSDM